MRCLPLLLALAAGPAAAAPAPAPPPPPPPPPDLLLVTFDTTRADHVGCYGAKSGATPRIDALARSGTRFATAFTPVPLTLPAHTSIMLGRPPYRHGVRDNFGFALRAGDHTLAEALGTAGYRTWAFVSSSVLDRSTGIDRGFTAFEDQVRVGPREWFAWEERAASQTVDAVLARLDQLASPWFVWVHFYDPHFPYVPPDAHLKAAGGSAYDGEIHFADEQLGRLLDALRARGLDRRMLVALAGDHGEGLGEHGEKTHDVFVYDATLRVPLVLAGPGVPAGKVVREPVGLVDLAPTLLDLLGRPPLVGATGRSLRPALEGKPLAPQPYEIECLFPALSYGWSPIRGVVDWPLKYIAVPRAELYDLAADPAEAKDLAAARPADVARLGKTLATRFGADLERLPAATIANDPDAAERLERLRSLGYASAAAPPAASGGPAIDPKDGIAWLTALDAARVALSKGEGAKAQAALEPLVAKNPDNLPARISLANALLSQGKLDEAVAAHREAVRRAPGDYLTHFNLGNALRQLSRRDRSAAAEAEKEFRAALALHPRHAESLQALVELLALRGATQEARTLMTEAEGRGVADPSLLVLRGALEADAGDIAAADAAFARALVLDPRFARALEGRGKVAFARNDARAAAGFYRDALAAEPSFDRARTLGSVLWFSLHDAPGARLAFERALALAPSPRAAAEVREVLAGIPGP